jgi:arginyl-tRNA synthetase
MSSVDFPARKFTFNLGWNYSIIGSMIRSILENSIKTALWSLKIDETKITRINLEHPENLSHGDYSSNIAMMLAKQVSQNPRELADKIVKEILERKPKEVSIIEVAGPGFINFHLAPEFFISQNKEILKAGNKFGNSKIGKGKKVVVEYSSPNIAKPFTIGHLRSTVIGDAIANILDFSGYKVIRDNHLGDWGTQFGKLIVAIKKWSSIAEIQKSKTPIKDLVALYVKFHDEAEKNLILDNEAREWFTKLEHNDKEAKKIWNICVKLSMKEFENIYKRLGVKFDTLYGESFFEDKMEEVIQDVKKLGIARESEGAYLVFFEKDKYPPMMLLKKDGSSLYALRDLAADKFRKKKYGKDALIINEVGMEQSLHFQQLFETEKLLGYMKGGDRIHVAHGFYRFPEGKMSTRKGNGIWLDEVLNEAIEKAAFFNKDTAEIVGVGAIKFNDLKRESSRDIIFNWDEILNLKGDSGPYLQYSYARARSILRKAKEEKIKKVDFKKVSSDRNVLELEKMLYRFPEVVARAGNEYSPHYIATYLIELASSFNSFYALGKIVDKADIESLYKVALTETFSIVLANGLNLLGIQVPEKM